MAKTKTIEAERILAEFVADVRAVGPSVLKAEWPDLYVTFCKARLLAVKLKAKS